MNLTEIDGVSKSKAEKLKQHRYNIAEDVAGANVAIITQIDGIGPDVVINAIRLADYDKMKMNHRDINNRCTHCGEVGYATANGLKIHEERCEDNPKSSDSSGFFSLGGD